VVERGEAATLDPGALERRGPSLASSRRLLEQPLIEGMVLVLVV
jgi:hypothetical protein